MAAQSRHLYEFAPFRLDPAERRLLRSGEPVALTPKCFDLLVALVESSGHLVEKDDLMARIWPGQFVEEGSLSFNVSELRRALNEGEDGRQYIETVRKKGFRFVAPVVDAIPLADPPAPARPRSRLLVIGSALVVLAALVALASLMLRRNPAALPAARPRTIAVLPFKPLAASVRDEPLEIGICNALITKLATIEELIVRPTSSVVEYNKMGQDPLAAARKLQVDALLEGYIQRSHDTIRVTARLLRTSDGKSLWTGQFNQNFTDIFTVEDSISQQIVDALHVNLTTEERRQVTKHATDNAEAYELYLNGRYFQDKRTADDLAKSIGYFQAATRKDPRYAVAFAALANSYDIRAVRVDMPPREAYRDAAAAAQHALDIDPDTAEAHSALASVKTRFEWDWPGAEREFKRAIELNANDPITRQQYAAYLMVMSRHDAALAEIRRAERLDPLSLPIGVQAARILYMAGRYDAAIDQCRKTLERDPNFAGAHQFLGRSYAQKRMYGEAIAELLRARTSGNAAEVLSLIGYTRAVSGNVAEAHEVLAELRRLSGQKYVSPYHFAVVYAGLGARDEALQCLEKAYDERQGRMTILKSAPEFASLRTDARFENIIERMKL